MEKESSVEWLVIQLDKIGVTKELIGHLIIEAKEIHKQEIIECSIETTQACWIAAMGALGQEMIFCDDDLIDQRNEALEYYESKFSK